MRKGRKRTESSASDDEVLYGSIFPDWFPITTRNGQRGRGRSYRGGPAGKEGPGCGLFDGGGGRGGGSRSRIRVESIGKDGFVEFGELGVGTEDSVSGV